MSTKADFWLDLIPQTYGLVLPGHFRNEAILGFWTQADAPLPLQQINLTSQ